MNIYTFIFVTIKAIAIAELIFWFIYKPIAKRHDIEQEAMRLMAEKLTTDYHSTDWVINYYKEKAKENLERRL